jgi:hypothetical protein
MQNKSIFLTILLLFMVACGPMYKTVHHYNPPKTIEGRNCVNSCDSMKQQCVSGCHKREQTCKMTSQVMDIINNPSCAKKKSRCAYRPHSAGCAWDAHSNCDSYSGDYNRCSSYSCRKDCDNQYNQCFTNCGGMVESKKVCTFNCN